MTVNDGKLNQYNLWKQIKAGKADAFDFLDDQYVDMLFSFGSTDSSVTELIKDYNVKISIAVQSISKETFSGYLDLKKSAIEVLKIIGETSDFDISELENELILNVNFAESETNIQ